MSTQYFANCSTVEQVKAEFRKLAMENHPDRGGDTAVMQEINAQYQRALKRCDGQKSTGSDGAEHTYRYDEAVEREVAEALAKILRVKMHADVAVIGTWIWIVGETKPVKEELKALGCIWHNKRVAWYWRPADAKAYKRSRGGLEHLAAQYGAKVFRTDDKETALA